VAQLETTAAEVLLEEQEIQVIKDSQETMDNLELLD
jgi:hypothetical protein